MQPHANPAIEQAMQSVRAATPRAEADPTRPVFHFRPPALWMNDPNGTIYHNGYYHVFYQHNPYGDAWGHMHWGHTRSRDLVHWENLPIALWPSKELGEEHCFSGCAWINDEGQPFILYTEVATGERRNRPPNQQWAALGDADLITWQKHPDNPVLSLDNHGGPDFEGDWRDPFIFSAEGRTFLVIGANLPEIATVALYEAEDGTLTRWRYQGILYQEPRSQTQLLECPNFIQLGDKWILLTSPYRAVEYVVGTFDVQTLTFTPEHKGVLDGGYSLYAASEAGQPADRKPNYYATNILFDDQNRRVLLGWIREFAPGRGWSGCLALPRLLSLGADGHPRQQPIPQLQTLRSQQLSFERFTVEGSTVLSNVSGDTLEIKAMLAWDNADVVGIQVRRSDNGEQAVEIRYDGQTLHVAGAEMPYTPTEDNQRLHLHLFLDRSVLELFVDHGRACITRVLDAPVQNQGIALLAQGGTAQAEVEVWPLKSIW